MDTPNQPNPNNKKTKTTKGRQKVEIKKVEKKSNLQVTFSKRRQGLFKKASELCVLCGAKVGIIVFSPKDKLFCFGHPDVNTVIEQYLQENENPNTFKSLHDHHGDQVQDVMQLKREYEESVMELEREKMLSEAIKKDHNSNQNGVGGNAEFWLDMDIEGMGMAELEAYVKTMEEMRNQLILRGNELMMAGNDAASASNAPPAICFGGDNGFISNGSSNDHLGFDLFGGAQF